MELPGGNGDAAKLEEQLLDEAAGGGGGETPGRGTLPRLEETPRRLPGRASTIEDFFPARTAMSYVNTMRRERGTGAENWRQSFGQPSLPETPSSWEIRSELRQLTQLVQHLAVDLQEVKGGSRREDERAAVPAAPPQPPPAQQPQAPGGQPAGVPIVPPAPQPQGPIQPAPGPAMRERQLKATFNGESENLPFFLMQCALFLDEFGATFPSERAKVMEIASRLEGTAGEWVVGLYDSGSPALLTADAFMAALRERFEDRFRLIDAENRLKTIKQANRSVAEYSAEFAKWANRATQWPEGLKVHYYREGLNDHIANFVSERKSRYAGLQECEMLAREAEERAREKRTSAPKPKPQPKGTESQGGKRNPGGPKPNPERERRFREGLCLKCGKPGHRAAACNESKPSPATPAGKKTPPAKSLAKAAQDDAEWEEEEEFAPEEEPALNYSSLP